MDSTFDSIRERLELLRRFDTGLEVFGASTHRYELEGAWTQEEVERFESETGVELPADFRTFLTTIGSAGAGPYYGLAAPSGDGIVSEASVERPFPLTDLWESVDPVPGDAPSVYDGCLFLADQGCGYFDFLVVSGEKAGEVWSDFTEAEGPIGPASDSFLEWYTGWLRRAVASLLHKRRVAIALEAPDELGSLGDAIAEVERQLEESPDSAECWRTLGYVRLGQRRYDVAAEAFESAAKHETDEPRARLALDRARLAIARGEFETALDEIDGGLEDPDLWGSTGRALRTSKVEIFDMLERPEDALNALGEVTENVFSTREYHFEKAYRHLRRGETDQALSTLEHAVRYRVGPAAVRMTMTRDDVYLTFAEWLDERGAPELAEAALEAAR
jgi:tetratricopeptide (TPR) repeat protein